MENGHLMSALKA